MLFYSFDMLDNFIKTDLICNLKSEKEEIEKIINLYHNKKMNLLSITTNMISMSDSLDKNKLDDFYETVSLLKHCFENINIVQELASKLKNDLVQTISLYEKNLENNKEEIKANLVEYNKKRDELSHKIMEFETINTSIVNSAIILSVTVSHKKTKKKIQPTNPSIKNEEAKVDITSNPYDNNTLIISEKDQKAYLPFFYSEIKEIYQNFPERYNTLQDVIEDLYILPLSQFKNSAMARMRESFSFIRKKEKGSIVKALDLGLELMFKYELNPIIIAACRNLDELDIYLDCLDQNELYDFNCFEIKFEVMPQLVKKPKNAF